MRGWRGVDFAVPVYHSVKIKKEKKKRPVLRPCLSTKKAMKHEDNNGNNCYWCTWNGFQMLRRGFEDLEIGG